MLPRLPISGLIPRRWFDPPHPLDSGIFILGGLALLYWQGTRSTPTGDNATADGTTKNDANGTQPANHSASTSLASGFADTLPTVQIMTTPLAAPDHVAPVVSQSPAAPLPLPIQSSGSTVTALPYMPAVLASTTQSSGPRILVGEGNTLIQAQSVSQTLIPAQPAVLGATQVESGRGAIVGAGVTPTNGLNPVPGATVQTSPSSGRGQIFGQG